MPLVKTQQIIDEQGFTLAVNVILLEQAEAFVLSAEELGRGLVLQLSENTINYHGSLSPIGKALIEMASTSKQPIAVHLDHATNPELVRSAADLGFSSVMFDGSSLDYVNNVQTTKQLVNEVSSLAWFEAELGEVGGKDGVHEPGVRTKPSEAAAFVQETGVSGLAVAVGSSHAMLEKSSQLDFDLISKLNAAISVPLVLHGSSGVSHLDLRRAIEAGIRKINIATELNVVFNEAIKHHLTDSSADPRKFLVPAREALKTHLVALYKTLG